MLFLIRLRAGVNAAFHRVRVKARRRSCLPPSAAKLTRAQFQQQFLLDLGHFVEFADGITVLKVAHTQPQLPQVTVMMTVVV